MRWSTPRAACIYTVGLDLPRARRDPAQARKLATRRRPGVLHREASELTAVIARSTASCAASTCSPSRRPPRGRNGYARSRSGCATGPLKVRTARGYYPVIVRTLRIVGASPARHLLLRRSRSRPRGRALLLAPNRSYRTRHGGAAVRAGALVLRLRSPSQTLILQSHLLALEPAGDGTWRALLTASFLGKGQLLADLELGGVAQQLTDELVVPRQEIELPARLRIERRPDGYRFEAVELPPSLPVEIRSQLGNRLVGLCETAAVFSFGSLDCSTLRASQRVDVPLPPPGPGAEPFLPLTELTADARATPDALLKGESR